MQSVRGVQMVLIRFDTYSISARARRTLLNGQCFVLKAKSGASLFLYINSPVYNLTMVVLQRNLLMRLVTPGSDLGKVSPTFPAALFSVDARFARKIETPSTRRK